MSTEPVKDTASVEQEPEVTYNEDSHTEQQPAEAQSDAEAEETAQAADPAAKPEAAAERQLELLGKQAEENYQRFLRTQADFDNFRRRSRLEKEELAKYASQKVVEQMLPVLDNFDRALASAKENADFEALVKGLDMIFRQFEQVLSQEGLTAMEAVGQPFNPEFHQAVMQVEAEGVEEGIVVEELQKGYMLKDKVIRPAMVKVSQ